MIKNNQVGKLSVYSAPELKYVALSSRNTLLSVSNYDIGGGPAYEVQGEWDYNDEWS